MESEQDRETPQGELLLQDVLEEGSEMETEQETPMAEELRPNEADPDRMEMEAEQDEETPKALLLPSILDRVFSFLDAESLLNARQVCKLWNERILENFEKRLAMKVESEWQVEWGTPYDEMVPEQLGEVDRRMLRSLRLHEEEWNDDLPMDAEFLVLEPAFDYFRSLPEEQRESIRVLDMASYDVEFRKHFVPAANDDLFRNLRELKILGRITDFTHHIPYMMGNRHRLQAGKLPQLKSLILETTLVNNTPKMTFDTFDVLLTAAPGLRTLRTSECFRLSGLSELTELEIMDVRQSNEETIRKVMRMMEDVQGTLRKLTLRNLSFWPPFPVLQNLRELTVVALPATLCDCNRNLTGYFPGLRKLRLGILRAPEVAIRHLCETWIPEGMARELRELELTCFPMTGNEDLRPEVLLNMVLNLNLPSLTLVLRSKVRISRLLQLLSKEAVRIEEREKEAEGGEDGDGDGMRLEPRVLVFRNGSGTLRGKNTNVESKGGIREFAGVVEKIRKSWDFVHFKGFEIQRSFAKQMMTSVTVGGVELFYKPEKEEEVE